MELGKKFNRREFPDNLGEREVAYGSYWKGEGIFLDAEARESSVAGVLDARRLNAPAAVGVVEAG
jgi:hypothetical protein